ncbi:MAG: flagellar protein [Lachnospiraceae bacterium]|nr:flagellar protein [Lachnospiraceae bacterium]
MDVRNCKQCSKLFNYIGSPICPECTKKAEDKFDEVKQYIYDHPKCGMQEVATEMEVSVAQIRKWLKEERLSFSEDSEIALNCEKCGKRILTGRFCKLCKESMANQLSSMYKKEEPKIKIEKKKTENKMRFLDNE